MTSPEMPGRDRSVVLETVVRLAFHTVLVLGVFLLFRGHNAPGGGFVGGLVVGCGLVLRYVSGGPEQLRRTLPVDAPVLLGTGLLIAGLTGVGGWVAGGQFLQSGIVGWNVPLLGPVKVVSATFFDIGVFCVVVGLVVGLLATLGTDERPGTDETPGTDEAEPSGQRP